MKNAPSWNGKHIMRFRLPIHPTQSGWNIMGQLQCTVNLKVQGAGVARGVSNGCGVFSSMWNTNFEQLLEPNWAWLST